MIVKKKIPYFVRSADRADASQISEVPTVPTVPTLRERVTVLLTALLSFTPERALVHR